MTRLQGPPLRDYPHPKWGQTVALQSARGSGRLQSCSLRGSPRPVAGRCIQTHGWPAEANRSFAGSSGRRRWRVVSPELKLGGLRPMRGFGGYQRSTARMPYFIILPAFALSFVAAALGTAITCLWRPLRPVFPFAWRAWLWGTLGFLVSNSLVIAAVFAIVRLEKIVAHGSWLYKSVEIVGTGLLIL